MMQVVFVEVGEEVVDAVEDLVVAVGVEAEDSQEEEADVASEVGLSYQHITSVYDWSLYLIYVLLPSRREMM